MAEKRNKVWENGLKKGELGESFLKWYCVDAANLSYKSATQEQNLVKGFDCVIEGIKTDVKNTPSIYLGKYSTKSNCFYARHPFRKETECENYCILDIDEEKINFRIKYFGSISEYLIGTYIKDEKCLLALKTLLQKHDKKSFRESNIFSLDHLMISLKKEIKKLIKPRIYCVYDTIGEGMEDEYSISLITYEDQSKKR